MDLIFKLSLFIIFFLLDSSRNNWDQQILYLFSCCFLKKIPHGDKQLSWMCPKYAIPHNHPQTEPDTQIATLPLAHPRGKKRAKSSVKHHCSPLEQVGAPRGSENCHGAVRGSELWLLDPRATPASNSPSFRPSPQNGRRNLLAGKFGSRAAGEVWRAASPWPEPLPEHLTRSHWEGAAAAAGEHCWGHRVKSFSLTNTVQCFPPQLFSSHSLAYSKTLQSTVAFKFCMCVAFSHSGKVK